MNKNAIPYVVLTEGRRRFGALLACVGASALLAGCGASGVDGSGRTHVAVAVPEMKVKVREGLASRAVSLVSDVSVDASGLLKAGSYKVGSRTLALAHDTPFTLTAAVPLAGRGAVDLTAGSATLSISGPATIDGIALPKQVVLKNHTASADVDVVGTLISAVVSRLPQPESSTEVAERLNGAISELSVKTAQLNLRDGSEVDIAGCKFTFAPQSRLIFRNVLFTDAKNFKGSCDISVGASKLHATAGDGELKMDGMKFVCAATAIASNGISVIDLSPAQPSSLNLTACAVSRGAKSLSIPAASLSPKTFILRVKDRDWKNASLQFTGAMQTGVANAKRGFGIPDFNATVAQLGLQLDPTHKRVTFEDCRVALNSSDVNELVLKHVPRSKTVHIDKQLIGQTPWRYKNVVARSVDITNLQVSGLKLNAQNAASLSCSADARVIGTIDKEHPLGALLRRNSDEPDTREWIATGSLAGPASVHFTVLPGKTFADARARADLTLNLNSLDNAKVDWSGVSSGLAGKAESAVLRALMGALKKHVTTKGIPISTSVTKPLFKHPDPRLSMLSVKSLTVKPIASGGTEVVASGYIELN